MGRTISKSCDLQKRQVVIKEEGRPLYLSKARNCHKSTSKPYGEKGITKYGKKVVSNTALLLEQRYGKKRLGFGTCTLPPMSVRQQKVINANWSEIVRRFYQKLSRYFRSIDRQFLYVGVTEIQEKRFEKTGVPVPHLHFVYVSRDTSRGRYLLSSQLAWGFWNSAVNQVLRLKGCKPVMGLGGHKGSVRLEPVRKSASGYLGKYLSKGSKVVKQMQEQGWIEFPKQWWTACSFCKTMFKKSLIHLKGANARAIFYSHNKLQEIGVIEKYVDVSIVWESKTLIIGGSGRFTSMGYNLVAHGCDLSIS